jgi:hypothetical protein
LIASGRPPAAKCFRTRHRVPACGRPAPIGVRPARRGGHLAAVEFDIVFIADTIERRRHVVGELAGFFQDSCGKVACEQASKIDPSTAWQINSLAR